MYNQFVESPLFVFPVWHKKKTTNEISFKYNLHNYSNKLYWFNRDRNWEVQAGSPDNIFDKKNLYMFN